MSRVLFVDGWPVSGNVASQILLGDAGTEINEEPGFGPNQAPRQPRQDTGRPKRAWCGWRTMASCTPAGSAGEISTRVLRRIMAPDQPSAMGDRLPATESTAVDAERFRTLLEINNAVVSNLTREALFHAIARALRRVVPFDRTALFLHDSEKDVLRLSVLESSLPSTHFVVGSEEAGGESPMGWVFRTRRPLLRRDLEKERQYPADDLALADGVRSLLVVPLIARGVTVGTLGVASVSRDQYSEADAAFLQEVASQVALAVANMKAYEDITTLSERVAANAERSRTLLEINNAVISNLTRDVLFHAIAHALRHVVPFDRIAMFLHDPGKDVLRLSLLESSLPGGRYVVGLEWALGTSHAGWAFQYRQALLRRDLDTERQFPTEDLLLADGVRSFVVAPLIARGKTVGTLNLNSATPNQYSEADAAFLQEVANQVALAVENMQAYEEITTLNARVAAAAERSRTLLEINNAIISNLTQDALFHAIAEALRGVVPFDRTAIFLHDPERDVLRLFVLESSLSSQYFVVGLEMGAGESHVGWVFQNQRPLLRRDLEKERQYEMEDRALADGVRSYVIVPLVARGTSVGVLAVASTRTNQYSDADVEFLQEVASQIALAVENMKAYEDITALNRAMKQEVARRTQAEEVLRAITEGTAAVTGSDFFYSLVRHLAAALGARYAFVTECGEERKGRLRTHAVWKGDGFGENFEYDAAMTPCMQVVEGTTSYHCRDLQRLFPHDNVLVELEAESYLGIPLVDSSGRIIGLLSVLDDKPMGDPPAGMSVLKVFASRAGAELERLKAEEALRTALAEVETLRNRLHAENVYLQEEIRREHNFVEMVGSSPALLAVLRKVEQVAPTDSTVLLSGETGTGKELIARAIHSGSSRRDRPLVKVNCSAISAGLVESELFGHVKGAFTGALERRIGRFELADGGTIFLDEVGELSLETQVKLLRVLQEQEFEPVGSSKSARVDVRVIAATNRDLQEAVRAGRFRADLFYRLNVFPLEVPALCERRSDIPQLVMFFLARFSKRFGKKVDTVSEETMDRLISYPWPGNIRELQNVIERAVVLAQGSVLALDRDLAPVPSSGSPPAAVAGPVRGARSDLASLEEMERDHILAALKVTGWVIEGPKGAAKILKLHPNTLRSRMEKLGIRRPRHEVS